MQQRLLSSVLCHIYSRRWPIIHIPASAVLAIIRTAAAQYLLSTAIIRVRSDAAQCLQQRPLSSNLCHTKTSVCYPPLSYALHVLLLSACCPPLSFAFYLPLLSTCSRARCPACCVIHRPAPVIPRYHALSICRCSAPAVHRYHARSVCCCSACYTFPGHSQITATDAPAQYVASFSGVHSMPQTVM